MAVWLGGATVRAATDGSGKNGSGAVRSAVAVIRHLRTAHLGIDTIVHGCTDQDQPPPSPSEHTRTSRFSAASNRSGAQPHRHRVAKVWRLRGESLRISRRRASDWPVLTSRAPEVRSDISQPSRPLAARVGHQGRKCQQNAPVGFHGEDTVASLQPQAIGHVLG